MRLKLFRKSKKAGLFLAVIGIVMSGYSQTAVTFNVDDASGIVNKELFGLLMERLGRQWSSIFVGTSSTIKNTNGMRQDVIDGFIECGIGAAEWPGGCAANGYSWSSQKKPSNDVGVDRFIQFCNLTGAEAVIAGKATGADAASNKAFASYIIDTLKYPLKWFKIGNEIWGGCGTNYTSSYLTGFTDNYNQLKTLKSSDNGKNLKIIAAAYETEGGNYNWITNYYNTLGNNFEAIEFHDYVYRTSWSSSNPTTDNYWQIMNDVFVGDVHSHLATIYSKMNSADASKRVKIDLDEWGDWLQGDNWMQTITLMDAISAGGHLNQFIQNADRFGVCALAQGVNVIHSVININTNGVMVKTPAFYVFKMYKPHHTRNAKFLPMTVTKDEIASSSVPAVNAAATVDASGFVNVSFVNVDLSATRQVTVTLTSSKASYTVKSADVITAPAYTTTNPFGGPEQVNIQPLAASSYSINGKTLTVTLPSKSVSMFRLMPPDTIPLAVRSASIQKHDASAFSIKAGALGSILITSSSCQNSPVTISLFGANGRTLINKVSKSFSSGEQISVLGNGGNGVRLVKITGEGINITRRITTTN